MKSKKDIYNQVRNLVELVYTEFRNYDITIDWGRANYFASIIWNQKNHEIIIRCNTVTKKWHEAALYGLLSHELSHPLSKKSKNLEMNTDIDVINRGLGIYLAIERLFTGKYEDHVIKRGRDRYLGYSSIRKLLSNEELEQLDRLLVEMRMIPMKKANLKRQYHDMSIVQFNETTSISIDGKQISVEGRITDRDVRIVDKCDQSIIYVKNIEVAKLDNNIS
ncbi:hypothetical protein EU527_15680 [Candidatus Thorarchaeota archaeon]|nr:MAG: hypothetical protein EU527_15680 [Candidatus Thorarchaeota archaeon]